MTQHQLAALIPAEYRREILLTNMITKAQAVATDTTMQYLFTIWKNYFEPTIQATCNACYERVLTNYKQLQPILIELERQNALLKEVI